MKKSSYRKFRESLLSHFRGGLFAFLFLVLIMGAYAAISYPTPLHSVSGVLGRYVGSTSSVYDGANAGSYGTAQTYCGSTFPGSHICTPIEVINSYNNQQPGGPLGAAFGVVWLNSGAPANINPAVNDCFGWTDNSFSSYASVWSFDNDYAGILPCAYENRYACCY